MARSINLRINLIIGALKAGADREWLQHEASLLSAELGALHG